jgi:hypothetical protein
MTDQTSLPDAIAESTAAFDAANHAWGRYFLYVLRPYHGDPPAPDPSPVRSALQEAAISVPQSADIGEARAFADTLVAAYRAVESFVAALPDPLRTGDVLTVNEPLGEALAWLMPFVE